VEWQRHRGSQLQPPGRTRSLASDETLIVDFQLDNGIWKATVVSAPAGYRVDCRTFADGKRYTSIKAGFTLSYGVNPEGRATDYGYNLMASRLRTFNSGRVLLMDYADPVIDFDGYPVPTNDDDDPAAFIPRDRHLGRVNVLLSDGSVQSFTPAELQPAEEIYLISARRGPNPGGTGMPAGTKANGNGNSSKN
jgi:prepilin-type processing-associated H-X9-DG protein